jgi:uncharacterized protein
MSPSYAFISALATGDTRGGKAEPGAKVADYFEFSEPLASLPSHRILALFRGEKGGGADPGTDARPGHAG